MCEDGFCGAESTNFDGEWGSENLGLKLHFDIFRIGYLPDFIRHLSPVQSGSLQWHWMMPLGHPIKQYITLYTVTTIHHKYLNQSHFETWSQNIWKFPIQSINHLQIWDLTIAILCVHFFTMPPQMVAPHLVLPSNVKCMVWYHTLLRVSSGPQTSANEGACSWKNA